MMGEGKKANKKTPWAWWVPPHEKGRERNGWVRGGMKRGTGKDRKTTQKNERE